MSARRASMGVAAAVFLLALALRVYHLGGESLWFDEAISYGRARLPLPELIADTLGRKHVPTYFLFMHYWVQLGDSEAFLRLPSALFGALTAMLVALASARLRGPIAGLAAGACTALASAQVYYGQEARMYTLLTAECALALYAYALLFTERARAFSANPTARGAYSTLALCSVALLYTHNTGMFCVAGLGALGLTLVLGSSGQRKAVGRAWVGSQTVALLLWLPWLPQLVRQSGTFDKWRNRPLSLEHATAMAEKLFALDHRASQVLLALAGLLLLALLRKDERRPVYLGLLASVAVGLGATTAASLLKANMFFLRTLLWCVLPLHVLVGCAVAALPRRWLQGLAVAGLLALSVPALAAHYEVPSKTPWRQFLIELVAHTEPSTPILSVRGTRFTGYYFGRQDGPLPARPVQEWEPRRSLEQNLPPGTRRFGVVMWRGSGRARAFYRLLQRSPFRPRQVWTRGAAYVAIYER